MDNFTSSCFTNAIDGYPGSLRRYWMMEEEDDDTHFLVDDDEAEAATYNHLVFRMHWHLFKHIKEAVKNQDNYFKKKYDATGKEGLSALQKCVAAIRILAYGVPADVVDEYVRIGESTAQKALHHFCRAVIDVFGEYYLRAPNAADVARLLQEGEDRGFLGMLGNIDCMHWEWRNCPTSWKGQFTSRGKHPSMILEAVALHDLWIWHAYFGMLGSNNDINVLHRSPVFSAYLRVHSTPVSFAVNGRTYNMGYYLADGIYPEWAAFVKTIRYPMKQKTQHFATAQESARKDIERAFGVLQTRFAVIQGPAYGWDRNHINDIMVTYIILHNMIVEDEQDNARDTDFLNIGELAVQYRNNPDREAFVATHHRLHDQNTHFQLQYDLIEH
ncbi:uncharacterized protein LOC101781176 [Setaria italica]|uniref:uncharacterized protein LOC101781176 n=1 Tax=Setaria italica TaxID=4555 RepID=UPI0006457559|nr:uncharacterized protein LOC101781176 [Setaria italica]